MTPTQQRIAIAQACGWKMTNDNTIYWRLIRPDGICVGHLMKPSYKQLEDAWRGGFEYDTVPDYPNDLNAMHIAEKVITQKEKEIEYLQILHKITKSTTGMWLVTATAAQRAEAFLRTLGLWKDSTPHRQICAENHRPD